MTSLRPATPFGGWSVRLLVGFALGLGGLFLAIALGERGGDDFTANWWLSGPAFVAAGCGIGAFLAGTIALVRGERAVSVLLATAVGLFVTWFIAAEVALPH